MTKHPELFAALASPFDPKEVKVLSKGGRQIHYVTARTVMNRLDSVLGPENWWARFEAASADSVACYLSVLLPDGRELVKSDLGGAAGMADAGDDDKSAASDALKRAAVHLGVARYLYRDGVPTFAAAIATGPEGPSPVSTPCPERPRPAPKPPAPKPEPEPATLGWVHGSPESPAPKAPRTGKQLFAWTKDREQEFDVGLLKYLNQWARLQDFPARMVDWDGEMVRLAFEEASRKLGSLQPAEASS